MDPMTARNAAAPARLVAIRLAPEVIARLDVVAATLTRPGLEATRTDALRVALMTGLQAIEQDLQPPPAKARRVRPTPGTAKATPPTRRKRG
jgi:hypothetical protein